MSKLIFLWQAELVSGEAISQIDEEGKEHLFKEVKDNFDKLSYFYLSNNKGKLFTVDLIKGLIYFNNYQEPQLELIKEKKNIRLIYFRRNFIDLKENEVIHHNVIYFLGIQWQDLENKNHKLILQIDSEGDFIISGE